MFGGNAEYGLIGGNCIVHTEEFNKHNNTKGSKWFDYSESTTLTLNKSSSSPSTLSSSLSPSLSTSPSISNFCPFFRQR